MTAPDPQSSIIIQSHIAKRAPSRHDIAIPMFGYKNHAGIDRAHGFIRGWPVTNAAAHDGAQLRNVVAKDNTASTVWAALIARKPTRSG